MSKWIVYKHTSPSGKVYVGVTKNKPEQRWGNGKGYKTNTRFYRAICKYGWDSFLHEVVAEDLTEAEAIKIETELIALYDSANKLHGYNVALGGHNQSDESRKKIGETRKARKIPSPTTGKHFSKETREKISKALTGKHHTVTEQARINIANAKRGSKNPNYGKPMREQTKLRLIEARSKPVVRIIGTNKELYQSAAHAEQITGIASCNISRVCSGKRRTAGGCHWEYA